MPSDTVQITSNTKIAENIYRMTLPRDGDIKAGQFYMLKAGTAATLLPRPISVCDHAGGVLTFLYQAVGRGTAELAAMKPGDSLTLTGPLGNGFEVPGSAAPEALIIPQTGNIALVGGGIGIAPMLLTAKRLKDKGAHVTAICGYRDETFLTAELESAADALLIATESGGTGAKGFVTAILEPEKYDAVFCCGPEPMMKAVVKLCAEKGTPVYLSLENKMACGIGACLVCTCALKTGQNRRVCKDGPVFRGEDVDFDA
ncbi:dihydroorotate dehydrogenase B (NAD(+)), electron transfer subunit [Clostridia bacterium]|nr:dihydroorotate dehydrogenase B (NAD(+)), electron transfer subunit [Clostridia bacterium]